MLTERPLIHGGPRRQPLVRVMEFVKSDPDLLQVIRTLGTSCRLPSRLNRWQEQRDQDANDGDDHQQFD
jgi:hypothetical protein